VSPSCTTVNAAHPHPTRFAFRLIQCSSRIFGVAAILQCHHTRRHKKTNRYCTITQKRIDIAPTVYNGGGSSPPGSYDDAMSSGCGNQVLAAKQSSPAQPVPRKQGQAVAVCGSSTQASGVPRSVNRESNCDQLLDLASDGSATECKEWSVVLGTNTRRSIRDRRPRHGESHEA
jgi:hypothetical protein